MTKARNSWALWVIPLLITIYFFSFPAYAQYGGGTGVANDPYQIATAEDLIALGETPEDYDKHFVLTANIDLDPQLPGRKVFDKAVIAPDVDDTKYDFQGTSFGGVFDGNGYTISHLTIIGSNYLGLFGRIGKAAQISNLGLKAINVNGTDDYIGGLAGIVWKQHRLRVVSIKNCNSTGSVSGNREVGGLVGRNYVGRIKASYCRGTVTGNEAVGGLVGYVQNSEVSNSYFIGSLNGEKYVGGLVGIIRHSRITASYSRVTVAGNQDVGGLVGHMESSNVSNSYSVGSLNGKECVGGLVGIIRHGKITAGYSRGTVTGNRNVGGLVGRNHSSSISTSYSTGTVSGDENIGGFVGIGQASTRWVTASFWDVETSGQATSYRGLGKTTAEMQTAATFIEAGWDFVDETTNGTEDIWWILEGHDYPRLSWEAHD